MEFIDAAIFTSSAATFINLTPRSFQSMNRKELIDALSTVRTPARPMLIVPLAR
jgi:hypothetical protein